MVCHFALILREMSQRRRGISLKGENQSLWIRASVYSPFSVQILLMSLIILFTGAPVHLVQSKILAATLLLCVESRVGHLVIVCFFQPCYTGQAVQQATQWSSSSSLLP